MGRIPLLTCLWLASVLLACDEPGSSPDTRGYSDAHASSDGGRRDALAPGEDATPDQSSAADAMAPDSSTAVDISTTADLAPAPDSSLPDLRPAPDRGVDQGSVAPDAAADAAPQLPDAAPLLDQTATVDAGQALAPTISPSSGSYSWGQTVTISTAEADASIYYTLEGSEPSSSSLLYGFPFALATEGVITVKAIAIKAGLQPSSVSSATYTIGPPALLRVKTPQILPAGGVYDSDQYVTISVATAGATIRYTTDGSRPTQFSTVYAGPILVGGHGTAVTVTAIAMKEGMVSSEAAAASYLISYPQVAKPELSPAGGTYEADQEVTISVATAGAAIRYTTDVSKPLEDWEPYTGTAIEVNGLGTTVTIKAIAYHEGMWVPSEIASETYVRACLAGNHDGGDGTTCVPNGQCVDGYHNDGTGLCVVAGCAAGYVYSADKCRMILAAVSAGGWHSCGLKPNGSIVCWGDNSSGQCTVPTLPGGITFTAVRTSSLYITSGHTCGLQSDGNLRCWGNNDYGQCNVPTLAGGATFTAVSAGGGHSCALKNDGTIACWGRTDMGQCTVPTLPGGTVYTQVGAGMVHSCGLKSDGTIACWGDNFYGQLNVPTLAGGTTYTALSAGYLHSCALKSDGTIACWGWNDRRQCNVPALSGGTTYTGASGGMYHSCGLKSDGTIACWGENYYGQLDVPTLPAGTTFTAVSAGSLHTCGLKSDGAVACWGGNGHGQASAP